MLYVMIDMLDLTNGDLMSLTLSPPAAVFFIRFTSHTRADSQLKLSGRQRRELFSCLCHNFICTSSGVKTEEVQLCHRVTQGEHSLFGEGIVHVCVTFSVLQTFITSLFSSQDFYHRFHKHVNNTLG